MPSANAVAALNFIRLSRLAGLPQLEDRARDQIRYFSGSIVQDPGAHSFWLLALMEQEWVAKCVVTQCDPS